MDSEAIFSFRHKAALVTGAGHGFGKAICKELVLRGADVMGTDVLADELAACKEELDALSAANGAGGRFYCYRADITDKSQVQALVAQTVAQLGAIHILVNNAGGVAGQTHQPAEDVTEEQWDRIVDINLKSVFFMIQAAAPHMKAQRYGRIVNISSGAGRSFSLTGIQAYASAKAGQIGLTRQMARELGRYGITVNNVAPGFVLSNPSTIRQWEAMGAAAQEKLLDSIAVSRLGSAEEIAYPVLFFASDLASYVSGQIISADGGQQMF